MEDLTQLESPVKKFLIRLHSGKLHERGSEVITLDLCTQTLIYFENARLGNGPRIYGTFEDGRVEEFIPSHTLNETDLADARIRSEIAKKLARFHYLYFEVPIPKVKLDLFKLAVGMFQRYDTVDGRQFLAKQGEVCGFPDILSWAYSFDWKLECQFLCETEAKVNSREVLCTNDMNRLNCLVRDGEWKCPLLINARLIGHTDCFGERVTLIDYENASWNNRGKDWGNHFLFWLVEVPAPTMRSNLDYPNDEIR